VCFWEDCGRERRLELVCGFPGLSGETGGIQLSSLIGEALEYGLSCQFVQVEVQVEDVDAGFAEQAQLAIGDVVAD
jgi:hypothetical protein